MTHQVRVQFGQSLEVSLYELGGAGPDKSLEVLGGEDRGVTETQLELGLCVGLSRIRGPGNRLRYSCV